MRSEERRLSRLPKFVYDSYHTSMKPISADKNHIMIWGGYVQYHVELGVSNMEGHRQDNIELICDVDYIMDTGDYEHDGIRFIYTGDTLYDNFKYILSVSCDIDRNHASKLRDDDIKFLIMKFPATYYGLQGAGITDEKYYEWFQEAIAKKKQNR